MLYAAAIYIALGSLWAGINSARWMFLVIVAIGVPSKILPVETVYGQLDFSDLLLPIVGLVVMFGWFKHKYVPSVQRDLARIAVALVLFVSVASISSLWGYAQADASDMQLVFSFLKLGKFAGYCSIGYAVMVSIRSERDVRLLHLGVIVSCLTAAVSLLLFSAYIDPAQEYVKKSMLGYKASNATAVMMACFVCYYAASTRWRSPFYGGMWARVGIFGAMCAGLIASFGRAGWFGASAGLSLCLPRRGAKVAAIVFVTSFVLAYHNYGFVRNAFDRTLRSDPQYGAWEVPYLNTGGRPEIMRRYAAYFWSRPILGSGFCVRGGRSGLPLYSSHNHYLQMLVETGVLGFLAFCGLLAAIWRAIPSGRSGTLRQADTPAGNTMSPWAHHGFRVAFVAVCTASLTETYLYGGVVLGALASVFGIAFAQRAMRAREKRDEVRPE